jgi:hypothetical protein
MHWVESPDYAHVHRSPHQFFRFCKVFPRLNRENWYTGKTTGFEAFWPVLSSESQMDSTRWRSSRFLTVLVILALCLGTQIDPAVSAKDDPTADAVPQKGGTKKKSASKKKTRQKAENRKPREGDDQSGLNAGSPQGAQSGYGSSGGSIPSSGGSTQPGRSGSGSSVGSRTDSSVSSPSPKSTTPSVAPGSNTAGNKPAAGGSSSSGNSDAGKLDANHPVVKRVIAVQNRITPGLISQKGVVATVTGLDEDDNVVIKVYTTGADNPKVPKSVDGISVLEIVTGHGHPLAAFNPAGPQPRPFNIGVSASGIINGNCGASLENSGTIGCRVKDRKGNVYALGCSHSFANENTGAVGDQCVQPSTADGVLIYTGNVCPARYVFGTLHQFTKLTFHPSESNPPITALDAAIVATTTKMLGNSTPAPPVGYGTPRSFPLVPFLRMPVQKFGKTTSLTTASVTGLNMTATIPYFTGLVTFNGLIEMQSDFFVDNVVFFAQTGDSGALVVSNNFNDRLPVGLIVGQIGALIFAHPIQDVLSFFDVTIDGDNSLFIPPGKSVRSQPNAP